MHKLAAVFATMLALFTSSLASAASSAESTNSISYSVRKGDTLINLAKQYMLKPEHYRVVQRQNRIANPYRMPIGKIILIPRDLLKYDAAKAQLLSVKGNVQLNASEQATTGQVVSEGTAIRTAESSFVTLQLDDGSRVAIPSNSDVRIRRLRTYILGGSMDYDFDIRKGAARSKVAPLKTKNDSYRVRTPKAVSAVRGTDFEARYDDTGNRDYAEVDEGGLAVDAGAVRIAVPAKNGALVPAVGPIVKEALLPPPELVAPGKMQVNPEVRFAATTANAHRFVISSDAGFVEQIADVIFPNGDAVFPALSNGNYFVRARTLAPSGIQGLPATYAFKRRLNSLSASAGRSDDGFVFKWTGAGDGVRRYHFQLFRGSPDNAAMLDEAELDASQVKISDLPPADYFWRVGTVQYLDGEVSTNWTELEKLTVSPS